MPYVLGQSSTTVNAVPRWSNTTGSQISNSAVLIDSSNNISGIVNLNSTGTATLSALAATTGTIGGDTIATLTAAQTLLNKRISSTAALTGQLTLPSGTTAQRASATAGDVRLNTDSNEFEGYANGAWQSIGSGLNEQPQKNYLKTYAMASVSPGTLSTVAVGGNITVTNGTSAFYADVTSGSAALTLSTSTALRGSTNYLSAVSGASLTGSVFFQLPAMTLEAADAGKPIIISFDTTGNTLSGDWDVVVAWYSSAGVFQGLIPVAGNASSSSSTPSAVLPTGTAQFNGFFVSTSTAGDVFALRFRRLANAVDIRFDTIFTGPQPVRLSAALIDWQSYTPVTQGFGTITTPEFFWRRVGDSIDIQGRFTAGTTTGSAAQIGLPTGLTINTLTSLTAVGKFIRGNSTASIAKQGVIQATAGTTYVNFGRDDYTTASNPFTVQNGSTIISTGELVSFFARGIPVVGWTSNITSADRAVEEYAFNTGATTAAGGADTTSFGYGASGTVFNSFNSTTANSSTSLRVRFQSSIQPTDSITLEVLRDGSTWIPVTINDTATVPFQNQNDSFYGVGLSRVSASTTDVDVVFGNKGAVPAQTAAAGFGANGSAWSTISTRKWRVRKVSSGAQIGGAISTSNIVGRVDGSTVGTGYIGEQITATNGGSFTSYGTSGTIADIATTTVTLTPGMWALTGSITGYYSKGATDIILSGAIRTAGNSTIESGWIARNNIAGLFASTLTIVTFVNIPASSGSTAYKLSISASATVTDYASQGASLKAVRIA